MIYFWTERQPGDPDILTPLKDATLVVTDMANSPIYFATPPAAGWTHDLLEEKARNLAIVTANGANAYLGPKIVGSTLVGSTEG